MPLCPSVSLQEGRKHLRHCERSEAIHLSEQATLDCFAGARNDEHLAALFAPEPCHHNAKKDSPPAEKREAERRKAHPTNFRAAPANVAICRCPGAEARHADKCTQSAHLSACGARSPSGATPRLSPGLLHPGSAPGHACWDRSGQAFYPPFPVPSPVEAPHASAVVPKGMMPKAAPAQVASPRGSTALAPHFRSHPECVPR